MISDLKKKRETPNTTEDTTLYFQDTEKMNP